MRNHANKLNSVIEQQQNQQQQKWSSPGHLVNYTWMDVGRFSLRLFFFRTYAWEPHRFLSFLSFSMRQTEKKAHKKTSFWRHECFMRILIEIISGMRMTSERKRFPIFPIILEEKKGPIAECLWTDTEIFCVLLFSLVKLNIAHYVGILIRVALGSVSCNVTNNL